MSYVFDDGGRAAAGYKGTTGDCGTRALAIATGKPYQEVYDLVNEFCAKERAHKRRKPSNARTGLHAFTMHKIAASLGGTWTATMTIGSGTTVHVKATELPKVGCFVLRLSKHYAAYIDGELRDNHDSSRDGTRAVYGFWEF